MWEQISFYCPLCCVQEGNQEDYLLATIEAKLEGLKATIKVEIEHSNRYFTKEKYYLKLGGGHKGDMVPRAKRLVYNLVVDPKCINVQQKPQIKCTKQYSQQKH